MSVKIGFVQSNFYIAFATTTAISAVAVPVKVITTLFVMALALSSATNVAKSGYCNMNFVAAEECRYKDNIEVDYSLLIEAMEDIR